MMKRLTLLVLGLVWAVFMTAQHRFEATVVDAKSGERLPFASIYLDQGTATISNMDGVFALNCDSSDVLRISYVGYETLHIQAGHLGNSVALQPHSLILSEVMVTPIAPMINKICKETLRMMNKNKNKHAEFFYRQTAFAQDSADLSAPAICYEFLEAFLNGGSAVALHDLKLTTGRYAGIKSDSTHFYSFFGNFYTFSQLPVAANYVRPNRVDDVLPLFRHTTEFFDVNYHVIDDEGRRIFVIHFEPKPEKENDYTMLAATLYVDEETLHLRRIVGEGRNFWTVTRVLESYNLPVIGTTQRYKRYYAPTTFLYDINLTEERGFPEVQSAFVEATQGVRGMVFTTRSILFKLNEESNSDEKKGNVFKRFFNFVKEQVQAQPGRDLSFSTNIQKAIEQVGYNAEFWRRNEIVRRTPVEEQVMELFENQQLFGVFQ